MTPALQGLYSSVRVPALGGSLGAKIFAWGGPIVARTSVLGSQMVQGHMYWEGLGVIKDTCIVKA